MGFLRNYFDIARQEAKIVYKETKRYIRTKKIDRNAKFELDEKPWELISLIVIVVIILIIIL